MARWFELLDDRFWLPPDEVGAEEANFIRRTLRLRKGQRVLDAPCGTGRVAYHLAKRGIKVVGVDLRPAFIRRGRVRFRKDNVNARLEVMDLGSMEYENEFHAVYCWNNSFGYLSEAENKDVAHRFSRALRPGGRLLVHQVNRERILRQFRSQMVKGGIRMRSKWDRRAQRLSVLRVVDGVDECASQSSQRLYTAKQMGDMLAFAGLKVTCISGSLEGDAYFRGSRCMIVVARKGASSGRPATLKFPTHRTGSQLAT